MSQQVDFSQPLHPALQYSCTRLMNTVAIVSRMEAMHRPTDMCFHNPPLKISLALLLNIQISSKKGQCYTFEMVPFLKETNQLCCGKLTKLNRFTLKFQQFILTIFSIVFSALPHSPPTPQVAPPSDNLKHVWSANTWYHITSHQTKGSMLQSC